MICLADFTLVENASQSTTSHYQCALDRTIQSCFVSTIKRLPGSLKTIAIGKSYKITASLECLKLKLNGLDHRRLLTSECFVITFDCDRNDLLTLHYPFIGLSFLGPLLPLGRGVSHLVRMIQSRLATNSYLLN